jgi:hypothetical protein
LERSSTTASPGFVVQSSMTCSSSRLGAPFVTLYQPKTSPKIAVPRERRVKV